MNANFYDEAEIEDAQENADLDTSNDRKTVKKLRHRETRRRFKRTERSSRASKWIDDDCEFDKEEQCDECQ